MINRSAKLSVSRQAILLGISRGSVYYQPRPVSDADLKLMHRIDKLHTEFPFAGSRMLQGLLAQEGFKVGRLHVATLMKRMGVEALYCKPKPVHLRRVHQGAGEPGNKDQHGRERGLARQRLCRAPLADNQIRGGLFARLRQRPGGPRIDWALHRLLQRATPTFIA